MKSRYLLMIGLIAFGLSLIATAPAATLYGWLAPKEPPPLIQPSGLSGSLFKGQAELLRYLQRPVLSGLSWELEAMSLLTGRLAYRLLARDPQLPLAGRVAIGLGGAHIDDFKMAGGIRALAAIAGQPFVPVNGQAALDLRRLRLEQGWPRDAEGSLQVVGLAWTLARDPVALGDFEASFTREQDDLVSLIRTLSGPLDLNGDARLKADRSYELHLQLRPKPDAPPMVQNLVRSIGTADAQGYFHIRRQGQMPVAASATP